MMSLPSPIALDFLELSASLALITMRDHLTAPEFPADKAKGADNSYD
jgi:hypothetical protein